MMKKIFLLLFITISLNATSNDKAKQTIVQKVSISDLISSKQDIDDELKDSIWLSSYENYKIYEQLQNRANDIDRKISRLERKSSLSTKQKDTLSELKKSKDAINVKLELLGDYTQDPFNKLVAVKTIGHPPKITNPFSILSALSFLENVKSEQRDYRIKYQSLSNTVENLIQKEKLLYELISISANDNIYKQELLSTKKLLSVMEPYLEATKSMQLVYDKKIEEITNTVNEDIKQESKKTMWVGMIILVLIGFLYIGKSLMRKYILDSNRFLKFSKLLNVIFIILVILVLLFAYIENAGYLATILGFASAGIAIAMKEYFMSIIGWISIFIGGSIKVGDRVRVVKNGIEYVGDVIKISPLQMTLYEDVTLTTYITNRRAGRIIFIPNNYIFTDMIASYNHEEMNTVWDGIDFMVTFDSNIEKASRIAKDTALKYSSQNMKITRNNLNRFRMKYHLRTMSIEPKIFTLIDGYGMKISVWYYADTFKTLTLRSSISAEIIAQINQEEDVMLAYPTQSLMLKSQPIGDNI